jgi:hypothetical protein
LRPSVWGPMAWKFMHMIAESLPENLDAREKNDLEQFMRALPTVLPCHKCREHLSSLYKNGMFPDCSTKKSYQYDLFRLHNRVNVDIGKPSLVEMPSLSSILFDSEPSPTMSVQTRDMSMLYIALGVLGLIIFLLIFRNGYKRIAART